MTTKNSLLSSLNAYLGEDSSSSILRFSKNTVDIIAISPKFKNLSTEERKSIIRDWQSQLNENIDLGLITMYTPKEARALEININEQPVAFDDMKPSTWYDLINWGHKEYNIQQSNQNTKVIAFYSYKGGVGRTTSLVHVAWILASRGKKVVIVDMDFEAPSLHQAVENIRINPKYGLVDYIYERVNSFNINESYSIDIADIIGEVTVPKGRLFIIPAGKVNSDYISKVDDLRNLPVNDYQLWDNFKDEIIKQIQPDLILIDSRTGINLWGALSMLQIADDSVVFMNPTPQNTEGISAILDSLYKVGIPPYIVLSPVISGKAGRERALREWNKVYNALISEINEDFDEEVEEPIMIPFTNEIALTDEYPCKSFVHLYNDVANLLDEESDKHKLIHILSGHERWKVIESFNFSAVDAKQEEGKSVRELFQKTADFDRFLDQTTVLVKGKKGTGKTQLYWTTINHNEIIKELAQGRIDNVIPMSGHGPATAHPLRDDFSYISQEINMNNGSWESFWRAYALFRLVSSKNSSIELPRNKHLQELREVFKEKPRTVDTWTLDHTKFLVKLSLKSDLRILIRDAIDQISKRLADKKQIVWLLYDDLDQDIPEYTQIQKDAISGLFSFVLTLENLQSRTIRTKAFLRTDIWHRLNFTNKSHFIGRDVELKWTREDFLRMALRQAKRSSQFDELMAKFAPVADINQASEDMLEKALELLWGIDRDRGRRSKKVSRWVYERLTDANGSTFPRALIYLLLGAKLKELEYQNMHHIQAPRDRLLRAQSLNEGLISASQQRCDELKQEYKDLDDIGFFTFLGQLKQTTRLEPLKDWWQQNATDKFDTFNEFMEQIKMMGLASEYDNEHWRFADLYVHGFEISRVGKM